MAAYSRQPDFGHADEWASEVEIVPVYHARATQPVTERRQQARVADRNNVVPTSNIVAGAICAFVSLAAIGYMVYALL